MPSESRLQIQVHKVITGTIRNEFYSYIPFKVLSVTPTALHTRSRCLTAALIYELHMFVHI